MDEFFIPILVCSIVIIFIGGILAQIIVDEVGELIIRWVKKHGKNK